MPHSRHSHSHTRSGHVVPSAALGPNSRTSSTTSLGIGNNKRSAAATAAAGLGFTQGPPNSKKKAESRPHGPYRNVSSESEHSRTRGRHAPTASQSTINAQQLGQTLQAVAHSSKKPTRPTAQTLTQAELLAQGDEGVNGEEDEDEWVSSSGAITPSSASEEEEETQSDRGRKALLIQNSLEKKAEESRVREHETAGTPRPDKCNVFTPNNGRKAAVPPLIERSDTQQTVQILNPSRETAEQDVPPSATATVIAIPTRHERPPTPPPVRSQPEPHRTPTSPHPTRNKAKTRPPSIRSITSHSLNYTQPHPLIRGSSYHHSESPQTPGSLHGPGVLAPLTGDTAPPVVTSSITSGLPVGSPPDMTASLSLASSTGNVAAKPSRVPSLASTASASTLHASSSFTSRAKRASFTITPSDLAAGRIPQDAESGRDRKSSTASAASITAISLLTRHTTHHQPANPPPTKSAWHFPTLPSLGLTYSPAPTRPSTPPTLSLKLPAPRGPDVERGGGGRLRNYMRRKQAHQFGEPDDDDEIELEPEDGEEGIGEWIPEPYFGEHLAALRWVVRGSAVQGLHGGNKPSASARTTAPTGILRQRWKDVCVARAGTRTAPEPVAP